MLTDTHAPADTTSRLHKIVRIILFLSTFSWTFNPIEDYMGNATPMEKIVTRMIPLVIVGAYCILGPYRDTLKQVLRPANWTVLWYIAFGVLCGISSIQPSLSAWKGIELIILLMWFATSCRDAQSTRCEFVAMVRLIEILLWITVFLAFVNPARGLRSSSLAIPWLQGYLPILNPNAIGFLSVITFVRLLFLPASLRPVRIAFIAVVLLVAQSRTSYSVMALALFIYVIDGLREGKILRVAIASSFGLIAAFCALGSYDALVRLLVRGQSIEELDSLSGRTDYWAFALQQVSWFGGGFATGSRGLIFLDAETFHKGSVNTHNSYIEALLAAGYIGSIPYLATIVINTLRQAWRALVRPSVYESLFLACAVMFVARGMTSIVLALYSNDIVMLFLFWAHLNHPPQTPPPTNQSPPKPKVYSTPISRQ